MLVYVCVCIFASVWAYETYQGPVNSAKSHESSKVWRGFTSQPFFFFLLKRQQPPRWRTGMEININKNNNNKNNNNMPVGTGSTASSKQDVEGSISSILIFKSFFFCFLVYPLSFFVFCPHCERKAGQDATWTLQRTLWQSGRGNRGVKRGALEGGGERGVKGAWRLPSDMP